MSAVDGSVERWRRRAPSLDLLRRPRARQTPDPLSQEVPLASSGRTHLPVHLGDGVAVSAAPERRHHRPGCRQGRHRLHLVDRHGHARDLAPADRRGDHRHLLRGPLVDGRGPRHPLRHLREGQRLLRARGVEVRPRLAHHPQHERRSAGADARDDGRHDARHRAAPGDRRHLSWRCSRTSDSAG